jgi:hypothetical protein
MALDASSFHQGLQSSIAQMAYTQRAAEGLNASLKSLAIISFAATIAGIGLITAAIVVATGAAKEWQSKMLDIAQLANIDMSTASGRNAYNQLSGQLSGAGSTTNSGYINTAVSQTDYFKAASPYAAADYQGEQLQQLTDITLHQRLLLMM